MQILDNPQKIVGPLNDTLRSHQLSRPEAMFLQYVTNKEKEDEDKDEDSDEEDNVLLMISYQIMQRNVWRRR